MASSYGDYLSALGGLSNYGGYEYQNSVNITTSNVTAATSNVVYLGQFNPPQMPAVAERVTPVKPDEFSWLRGRVDEVCWKAA